MTPHTAQREPVSTGIHILPRSLSGRIIATTIAVAVIAVLAVSVAGFHLMRQESLQQSSVVLRTSAQAIAAAPASERTALAAQLENRSHGRIDIGFGGDGDVSGIIVPLPRRLERRLSSERQMSGREVIGWRTLLFEAAPVTGGGSVIAVEDASILHGDRVLDRFGLAFLIGLAVAVGLGVGLARLITRPLRLIAAHAARLAEGERGSTAALTHNTRQGVSSKSVSEGTGRFGSVAAPREIAEIQHALGVLDAELARSEGAQREFLLSISHEFRTPLSAVRGYADALCDDIVPAADVPRVAAVMRTETERLDAFVGDLLALARLEADDFTIRLDHCDLVAVIDQAVAAWSGRAATLNVTVERRSTAADINVVTDPLRVRQLIDGLIENALRVSPSGGAVTLNLGSDRTQVTVRVIDSGPGLDDTDLQHAFVRGALRERHRGDRPVGTGLGLSIAARLTGRLGGTIQPVARVGGAEFRVTLPRRTS